MKHKDYTEIHAGVEVTRRILDRLKSPDKFLKIIHIAGSNGKGSTAAYFTSILKEEGERVGTFTSPAVYDFYDQFLIDGKVVDEKLFEKYFEYVKKISADLSPTEFELQTACALYMFREEGCKYAVLECGMGGLSDATNAIERKELAVITSITLEHTTYLGNTIGEICRQKAGIIKNCRCVINAYNVESEVREFFSPLGIFADGVKYDGKSFSYGGREYMLPTFCECQAYDAATAIEGAKILGFSEKAIYNGIKNAKIFGRTERTEKGGKVYILDGAHNPQAFLPLSEMLSAFPKSEITVIFGCLADKDIDGNLLAIKDRAENIIAVECESPRKMPLEKIYAACKKYFKNADKAKSVTSAMNMANTECVAVCGSFTLLREARQWIKNSTEIKP